MQTQRMRRLGVGLAVCAAVALSSLPIKASHAQYEFHLTVDGTTYPCNYAGLSAAIDAVNEVWNGVITLNCPGQNIVFPTNAAKHIRGGFVLDGLDANSVRLDAVSGVDTQFFVIEPTGNAIFRNITMQHAEHNGHGGAILVKDQGQLVLESSVIAWCHAFSGGGAISMEGGGWLTLRVSELVGNYVVYGFGAGNPGAASPSGGAIEATSTSSHVVVANSKINQNRAIYQGGGIVAGGELQVISSMFDGNVGSGAAIADLGQSSVVQIDGSVFQNNTGRHVIEKFGNSTLNVAHSEFSNNQVDRAVIGSAVYTGVYLFSILIDSSVFVNNRSNEKIIHTGYGAGAKTTIQNSVFADNTSTYDTLQFQNPFTLTNVSLTNNDGGIKADTGLTGIGPNPSYTGYMENVTIDGTRKAMDINDANCFWLTIVNSTISHYGAVPFPSAVSSPAIYKQTVGTCPSGHSAGAILLKNTVIDVPVGISACKRDIVVVNDILGENSVASDNTCKGYVGVNRTLIKLGPLQDNGGQRVGAPGRERTLLTRLPLPGSVLIDSGGLCSPFDERGFSRGPFMCDIGAVEVGATAP